MFPNLLTHIIDYSGDLFRNIKTARVSIDCYDDLGDGEFDTEVAVHAEMAGHTETHAAVIDRPFDYGRAIAFSFDAANWQPTRFSDGLRYGVWYGSEELETTVHESAYHWKRFVLDAFPAEDHEIVADRRVFLVRCQGFLVDLVGKENNFPALINPDDYSFTQKVGSHLVNNNQAGLRVLSARCQGVNAAIFSKEVLSNPRDHCYLSYYWNPVADDDLRVERERGTPLMMLPAG
jgi:RES domain